MKKWLNIKPKVYDFSEDEVDTETESEDDGMCHWVTAKIVYFHFVFFDFTFFLYDFLSVCSLKNERTHKQEDRASRAQRNLSTCSNRISGTTSMSVF